MYTYSFSFKLQKEVSSKSTQDKLMSSIKNALLYSDQYTFGRNLTITKPLININKNKVTVSVELFKQFKDSLFKTAENKFLKYLEEHKGYQFEGQKHNVDKKTAPKLLPNNKKKTGKKTKGSLISNYKKTGKKK